MGRETVVSLHQVSKTYIMGEVKVAALKPTDLEINRGEILVLLGPSGSGKSTLLNLIGGVDRPSSGKIVVNGRDITNLDDDALTAYRRDMVGFVFQFFNLIPNLTVRENVELALEITGKKGPVDTVLEKLGIGDKADQFPSQLSGGEQQRVAIARALVKQPELLLCDEPTGALDSATGARVLAALWEINRDTGKTLIIITHNVPIAAMADRVIHLRDGRIEKIETNAEPVNPLSISW
ncbi:MAG: ABC transporter ATP-binding protein [Peptococcaceae bacterium]|nr:ABC transporter ATP-binding protein [Peptococcaceae bacterium]